MHAERPTATVLLVDDDEMDRLLVKLALDLAGYRVAEAGGVKSGLGLAAREQPDAIVVDCVMPGMDGLDLCRGVRGDAALRHIPIVMLTGLEDPRLAQRALAAGADRLVAKSSDPAPLLRELAQVLSARERLENKAAVS